MCEGVVRRPKVIVCSGRGIVKPTKEAEVVVIFKGDILSRRPTTRTMNTHMCNVSCKLESLQLGDRKKTFSVKRHTYEGEGETYENVAVFVAHASISSSDSLASAAMRRGRRFRITLALAHLYTQDVFARTYLRVSLLRLHCISDIMTTSGQGQKIVIRQ